MASLDIAFSAPPNIPPRDLNGGLYTGKPFIPKAPWANVPVIPDASYMIHHNLRSAQPPAEALFHYPGHDRPGNNHVLMHGVQDSEIPYNMRLIKDKPKHAACACSKCRMSKYAYL